LHTSAIQVDLANRQVITPRLQLTSATIASLEAELRHDFTALADLLSATVPFVWPPDYYDDDADVIRSANCEKRRNTRIGGRGTSCFHKPAAILI
jgi:hypothetical protein